MRNDRNNDILGHVRAAYEHAEQLNRLVYTHPPGRNASNSSSGTDTRSRR